jgi:hypothetical protein
MTAITTVDFATWRPEVAPELSATLAHQLEDGGVIVLPRLAFALEPGEERFLDVRWSNGRRKNISLSGERIRGARGSRADRAALARMIARYAADAAGLIRAMFPRYAPALATARTSFRPMPATGRRVSWRKDDTRLHVDAFPSRPTRGTRILRVFNNVNPAGQDRVWRVGERFEDVSARFLPRLRRMHPVQAALLARLHVTKGVRTEYDHLMLGLHDAAKADLRYQRDCEQQEVHFAPGTTWICFSDQVMHAAMAGQYMLEQTIQLPSGVLYEPAHAPLAVLERMLGRPLVPAQRAAGTP